MTTSRKLQEHVHCSGNVPFTTERSPDQLSAFRNGVIAGLLGGLVCLGMTGCDTASGRLEWTTDKTTADQPAMGQPVETIAELIALIDHPAAGDVVTAGQPLEMSGRMATVPDSGRGYVFAADEYRFYLQYPALRIEHRTGRFRHRNIRLATAGSWELHVVWAEPQAARELEARAAHGDFGGLPALPDGVQSVRSIQVVAQ